MVTGNSQLQELNTANSCQGCGSIRILTHWWWKCEWHHHLENILYIIKLNIYLPYGPHILPILPEKKLKTFTHNKICIRRLIALFITVKN